MGLSESHAAIRIQSLKILKTHPEWWNKAWPWLQSMSGDPSSEVRFHVALSLGQHPHPDNEEALLQILMTDMQHAWSRRAVYTSLRKNPALLLEKLWQSYPDHGDSHHHWNTCLSELAYMTTARLDEQNIDAFAALISSLGAGDHPIKTNAIESLLDGAQKGAILASLQRASLETLQSAWKSLYPRLAFRSNEPSGN